MSDSKYQGKRYICLVRASHGTQEISTDAQLKMQRAAADAKGMIFVGAKILDGMTGSLPGKREDLEELLESKRTKNNFEVLVIQRCDRLTRGGYKHGFWFEWECQCLGIELMVVGDDIPDGEYADFAKFMKYQAAKEQAFSISQRSTQGSQFALDQGRIIPSSRTPFGCWRLYLTADGKPSHIIRNLIDGRQEKLDSITHAVIDTLGRIGGGSTGHYRKQKDEMPQLMPGDSDKADAVREIFRQRFIEGKRGKIIANFLNKKGILSPTGRKWSQHQVESIYNNEVYTGRAIANRTSNAIYHKRQKNAPKKIELDPQTYATAKSLKVKQRPFEEWEIKDEPLMKDFLEPTVRERAMAEHERRWAILGNPNRPKQSKSKHKASDYLLSELFFAKQDGGKLTGIPCGPKHKKVRYYRHRNQMVGYEKGSIFNGMFPAAPLETAILDVIAEQLQNLPQLREQIVQTVNEQTALLGADVSKLEDLRKRREQIKKRTEWMFATFDEATLADAKAELDRLGVERKSLEEQIAAAQTVAQTAAIDPQQVADAVIERLKNLPSDWKSMPVFALRETIGTFVEKAIGDMGTKDVEVRLQLPTWAFSLKNGDSEMRLEDGLRLQMHYETHALLLAVFDCHSRGVIATAASWLLLPTGPIYRVPEYPLSLQLTVWSLIAGPVLGLATVPLVRAIGWADAHKPHSNVSTVVTPIVLFSILGLVSIAYPQLLGNGKDAVQLAFSDQFGIVLLLVLPGLKFLATAGSLRAGASGGLFTPTMTIGALLGGLLGHLWDRVWPGASMGSCSVIGSCAFLAAASQGPISALVLVLELTRHIDATMVPMLLAVAGAMLIARRIESGSIYSIRLHLGNPPNQPATPAPLPHLEHLISGNFVTMSAATGYAHVIEHLLSSRSQAPIYILDHKGGLVGIIDPKSFSAAQLGAMPAEAARAADLVIPIDRLNSRMAEDEILDRIAKTSLGELPMIDTETGQLVSVVTNNGIRHRAN